MKRGYIIIAIVCVGAALAAAAWLGYGNTHREAYHMTISSKAFSNGGQIPDMYGCRGANVSPPLAISGVPEHTKSLALVVSDPDAPGGIFYHWLLWNLPANQTSIAEHWQPEPGIGVGTNGFGTRKWQGPCPPSGTHHYRFTLYALDGRLDLADGASAADVLAGVTRHTVTTADLVGTYSK